MPRFARGIFYEISKLVYNMTMTFREALQNAETHKTAIGHFNIADLVGLKAVFEAARGLNVPVLVGVSEGEREFIGVRESVALVRAIREIYNIPIFLNADHTHSLDKVEEAARAGFDEILFDGSKLPFDENVAQTKRAVEIVKSINPDIIVEGELGYIGSSSEILKNTPEGAALNPEAFTKSEEARQFVTATGVDVFAPAVGNMHGLLQEMVTGDVKKHLDVARIGEIKAAIGISMTLHGGSGTADQDFKAAIAAGMTIVHVSTELRIAWRRGVEEGLRAKPDEVAPYKILPPALEGIRKIVEERLKLFNGIS